MKTHRSEKRKPAEETGPTRPRRQAGASPSGADDRREAGASARGREAAAPPDVPAPGWGDILWRTFQQLGEDNLNVVAAGVAFYAFVAVVPALAATIGIYALFTSPATAQEHLEALGNIVPAEVMPILREQITRIVSNQSAAGWSAALGLAFSLYGSAKATKALIVGLNIAYDEKEKRGFLRLNLAALLLTLTGIVAGLTALALVAVLPAAIDALPLPRGADWIVSTLRWPLLLVCFIVGLAALYRFAPSRTRPQWKWVSWGAVAAAVLWVVGSGAFSFYVSRFAQYEGSYGSLGAIVVFLFWLLLSAFVILLGAELNAEMERQTREDTTAGEPKPLGRRGAHAADTVGRSRPPTKPEKDDDGGS